MAVDPPREMFFAMGCDEEFERVEEAVAAGVEVVVVDHENFFMLSLGPVNFGHVLGTDSPRATRVFTTAGMSLSSCRSA